MNKEKVELLFQVMFEKDYAKFLKLIQGAKKLDVLKEDKASVLTPLGYAARLGSLKMVEALLERGADPNAPGRGTLPLFEALARPSAERVKILQRLLAAGADPRARLKIFGKERDCFGHFYDVSNKENAPGFEVLLEAGAKANAGEPNDKKFGRYTHLYNAVLRGWYETAALLLAHGAKPDTGKPNTEPSLNPLRVAVQGRHTRMVRLLASAKASTKFLQPHEMAAYERITKAKT